MSNQEQSLKFCIDFTSEQFEAIQNAIQDYSILQKVFSELNKEILYQRMLNNVLKEDLNLKLAGPNNNYTYPHNGSEEGKQACPTYYDGCHCSVEALEHNTKRAERAEAINQFFLNPKLLKKFSEM